MPRSRRRVGYYRVSLADADEARAAAIATLKREGVQPERLFGDVTESDAGKAQPELEACLRELRRGDTLVVASLDRLGPRVDLIRKAVGALITRAVEVTLLDGPCAGTIAPVDLAARLETWLAPAEDLDRRLRGERRRETARKEEMRALRESEKRGQRRHAAIERLIGQRSRKPTPREKRIAELGYKDFFAMTPEELDLLVTLIRDHGQSRNKAAEITGLPYDTVLRYVDKEGNEQEIAGRMRRDAAQGGPERRLRKAVLDGELPEDVLPKRQKLRVDLTRRYGGEKRSE